MSDAVDAFTAAQAKLSASVVAAVAAIKTLTDALAVAQAAGVESAALVAGAATLRELADSLDAAVAPQVSQAPPPA